MIESSSRICVFLTMTVTCLLTPSTFVVAQETSAPIRPQCPAKWSLTTDGKCTIDPMAFTSPVECKAVGLKWDGAGPCTLATPAPPNCGNAVPDLVLDEKGECVVKRTVPRSFAGDYVGDCLKIVARPDGTNLGIGKTYLVLSQSAVNEDRDIAPAEKLLSSRWYL